MIDSLTICTNLILQYIPQNKAHLPDLLPDYAHRLFKRNTVTAIVIYYHQDPLQVIYYAIRNMEWSTNQFRAVHVHRLAKNCQQLQLYAFLRTERRVRSPP